MATRTWGWRTTCGVDRGDGGRSINLAVAMRIDSSRVILCPLARRQDRGGGDRKGVPLAIFHALVAIGAHGFWPASSG